MKFLKNFFTSPDFLPLVIVLVFGVLASWSLFGKGYFNMHDDLQMMRQLEMEKCFADGQVPCRWVPDMGYGFGFPLFNFYPLLPYLVGQVVRVVGYDFVSTAKALFIIAIIASGVTMYFLAREFFGRLGGVLAAVFYVWAPYHAVDVYVRGAMNESWALIWFPLILWLAYKLIKSYQEKVKVNNVFPWIIGLALSWFALLTSHNLMVLAFGPPFALWCLLWLIRFKAWRSIPALILAGAWAFGLAAFFTFPAVTENKFTHIDSVTVGYYDYSAHFPTLSQLLLSRFWGYGPSVWLENDGMSFQIGHLHWIGSLLIAFFVGLRVLKSKKFDTLSLLLTYLLGIGWFAAFLIHSKSTPIWVAIPPLRYLQFSWRLLSIVILCFSLMFGALPSLLRGKLRKTLPVALMVALVALNWSYFKPEHGKLGPLTDDQKFTAAAWELQQTAGIWDYLPKTAIEAPKAPQKYVAENARGELDVKNASQGTNWAKFDVAVTSETGWVRVGIMTFPGWKAYVDGKELEIQVPDEEKWGRMWLEVPQGEHHVEVRFTNTPVRTVSNAVTVVAWLILLTSPLWLKKISRI